MTSDVYPSNDKPTPTRRRLYRFSVRSLLVLITLVACLLGWMAIEQRQSEFERQVGIKFENLEQEQVRRNRRWRGSNIVYLGPYDSLELHKSKKPQGWWRDLARQILGERIFKIDSGSCVNQKNFILLARLKNLEELRLNTIPVTDLAPLAKLENLKRLHLYNRTHGCDLIPLAGLKNLESLTLAGTSDRDLTPLIGLTNLKSLHVTASSVSDLTPLAGLTNLELLDLTNSSSVDDLTPLTRLMSLEELKLTGTSVSNLAPIAGLRSLRLLHLGFVKDLTPLARLKTLNELYVSGTSSIDEQVELLQQALPNCRIKR